MYYKIKCANGHIYHCFFGKEICMTIGLNKFTFFLFLYPYPYSANKFNGKPRTHLTTQDVKKRKFKSLNMKKKTLIFQSKGWCSNIWTEKNKRPPSIRCINIKAHTKEGMRSVRFNIPFPPFSPFSNYSRGGKLRSNPKAPLYRKRAQHYRVPPSSDQTELLGIHKATYPL